MLRSDRRKTRKEKQTKLSNKIKMTDENNKEISLRYLPFKGKKEDWEMVVGQVPFEGMKEEISRYPHRRSESNIRR